jgi:hypothetical protein
MAAFATESVITIAPRLIDLPDKIPMDSTCVMDGKYAVGRGVPQKDWAGLIGRARPGSPAHRAIALILIVVAVSILRLSVTSESLERAAAATSHHECTE